MLTIKQIQELLAKSERMILLETRRGLLSNYKRLMQLHMHRILLKDCLIEALQREAREHKKAG